jgi:hypothetical protein
MHVSVVDCACVCLVWCVCVCVRVRVGACECWMRDVQIGDDICLLVMEEGRRIHRRRAREREREEREVRERERERESARAMEHVSKLFHKQCNICRTERMVVQRATSPTTPTFAASPPRDGCLRPDDPVADKREFLPAPLAHYCCRCARTVGWARFESHACTACKQKSDAMYPPCLSDHVGWEELWDFDFDIFIENFADELVRANSPMHWFGLL